MKKTFVHILAAVSTVFAMQTVSADTITVSAAASLKEAFQEVNKAFVVKHPDTKVDFNFAASGSLLQQISNGAPVDVFASADLKTMQLASEKGLLLDNKQTNFVKNDLVAIVPAKSALHIQSVADLTHADIKRIAIGNEKSVPAGRYTMEALRKANVADAVQDKVVLTQNVRQALEYVADANVDVGFVYKTDATLISDRVKELFVVPLDTPVIYPIAVLKNSQSPAAAKEFVDFVLSNEGQAVLGKFGFSRP